MSHLYTIPLTGYDEPITIVVDDVSGISRISNPMQGDGNVSEQQAGLDMLDALLLAWASTKPDADEADRMNEIVETALAAFFEEYADE